ncbi:MULTISPECIES: RNA polymerase sigma factor [Pantoea]|uniref:RNA polymerase sigma factor n=1 Tax=Pantoea TaxID=53335 RepID=UPI0011A0773E|nr:sigma factor-like helix-turn-helix DNA-binding protein [Pantoea ananatis]
MIIPLKKCTRQGEPYQRRTDIEDILCELDTLAVDQLVARLTCGNTPVPLEILFYYLRHSEIRLAQQHLQPVFTTFYDRVDSALRSALSPIHFAQTDSICDEITGQLLEMIAQERNSHEDNMYYWEVNFNHALSSLRKDVLKRIGPARKTDPLINYQPLMKEDEEGTDFHPKVEDAAERFFNPTPSLLDDEAFRLCLMEAINTLPEDEKRVVGLFLQGMQIESLNPEVMTIAKALACTDRTVRNRLSRAHELLRTQLQNEGYDEI